MRNVRLVLKCPSCKSEAVPIDVFFYRDNYGTCYVGVDAICAKCNKKLESNLFGLEDIVRFTDDGLKDENEQMFQA